MSNFSDTSKKMFINIIILFCIELILSFVYFRFTHEYLSAVLGLIIGTGVSIIKLISLENSINKVIEMSKAHAVMNMRKNYFFRQILTIIIFVLIALNRDIINIFTAAIGLINMNIGAYMCKMLPNIS